LQLPKAHISGAAEPGAGINGVRDHVDEKSKWNCGRIRQPIHGFESCRRHPGSTRHKQGKAQPGAKGAGEICAGELARQKKNFERLVLQNARLNTGYIAVDAWLIRQSQKKVTNCKERLVSFWNGMRLWIAVQRDSLLIHGISLSLLVYRCKMNDIP
jgi:hypothetical protein